MAPRHAKQKATESGKDVNDERDEPGEAQAKPGKRKGAASASRKPRAKKTRAAVADSDCQPQDWCVYTLSLCVVAHLRGHSEVFRFHCEGLTL